MDSFERYFREKGFENIAGIDEAGRGPLAGPVVASCVILPRDYASEGIRDSKQLTPRMREKAYWEILQCGRVGVGVVSEKVIDQINILQASLLAMKFALLSLCLTPDLLLIDGIYPVPGLPLEQVSIAGGDAKSISIAAASIVAKVTRDKMMEEFASQYPAYGFSKHKGYPTEEHLALLAQHGPSPIHRMSFHPMRRAAGAIS